MATVNAVARDGVGPAWGPTWFLDYDNPTVREYAENVCRDCGTARERAICLFRAVRDDIRYDPYLVTRDPAHLKASRTLMERAGYCVPKAVLLAACARAMGIPARIAFADVVNHLSTEGEHTADGAELVVYHGYAEMLLEGRWVKSTPTFNRSLCERIGVESLDFNGVDDALFQPYDRRGERHMEYVRDHGSFCDVPWGLLFQVWSVAYPGMFEQEG